MAHGLSCSAACGIFPDQGSNLCPLPWQADSQPLCHQGSPEFLIFKVLETEVQKFSDVSKVLHPVCSSLRSKFNHSSIIYNSQKMEATQVSMDR